MGLKGSKTDLHGSIIKPAKIQGEPPYGPRVSMKGSRVSIQVSRVSIQVSRGA
jgi:hypothetical protein